MESTVQRNYYKITLCDLTVVDCPPFVKVFNNSTILTLRFGERQH